MITFQYFDGCPNSEKTLQYLQELIKEKIISENKFEIIEVPDLSFAERYNFQGSPSILVDGVDIYTMKKPKGFNFSCRIYEFDEGIMSKEYIRKKILQLQT